MDYSPPGSSILGILQARIQEWVTFPSPGDLPDPGIEPGSPALHAEPQIRWCRNLEIVELLEGA